MSSSGKSPCVKHMLDEKNSVTVETLVLVKKNNGSWLHQNTNGEKIWGDNVESSSGTPSFSTVQLEQLYTLLKSTQLFPSVKFLFPGTKWFGQIHARRQHLRREDDPILLHNHGSYPKTDPIPTQVYLSLYSTVGHMVDLVASDTFINSDLFSLSSLKIAIAYNEALLNRSLTGSKGEIVQSTFLGSLRKRFEEILNCSLNLKSIFGAYVKSGEWPTGDSFGNKQATILSWYLQWHNAPSPVDIRRFEEKIRKIEKCSWVPLLRLVFPGTHIAAIHLINNLWLSSSKIEG